MKLSAGIVSISIFKTKKSEHYQITWAHFLRKCSNFYIIYVGLPLNGSDILKSESLGKIYFTTTLERQPWI